MENPNGIKMFFKFRPFLTIDNIYRIKAMVADSRIYFPNRSKLNDPFESIVSEIKIPGIMGSSIYHTTDQEYNFIASMRDEFKILALSTSCFSPLMWAHYGNEHKGVCLCFRADMSFKNAAPVNYTDILRSHVVLEQDRDALYSIIHEDFFYKRSDWEYEKEWRIVEKTTQDYLPFDIQELLAVIFGHSADESYKKELIDFLPPHVQVFKTRIGTQSGKIHLVRENDSIPLNGSPVPFIDTENDLYNAIMDYSN